MRCWYAEIYPEDVIEINMMIIYHIALSNEADTAPSVRFFQVNISTVPREQSLFEIILAYSSIRSVLHCFKKLYFS